jgi:integrase
MYTISDVLNKFEQTHLPTLKPRTRLDYSRVIAAARQHIGHMDAHTIKPSHIRDFLDVASATADGKTKHLACLSSAFEKAVQHWAMMEVNVCKNLERKKWVRRERKLTEADYDAVWKISPRRMRLIMDLAINTGASQTSILQLQWSQVGPDYVTFNDDVRGELQIKLTSKLRLVLRECEELCGRGQYVIPRRDGMPYTGDGFRAVFQRYMRRSEAKGGPRFTYHDLRARFSNRIGSDGIPSELQELVDAPRERLDVEYKEWLDLADDVVRANVARHVAALANHGGGYLVFGIADDRKHVENTLGNLSSYTQDTFAGIVKKYLLPTFHCDTYHVRPNVGGDECVVVGVPSHQAVPICSRADGPQEKGKSQGIRRATYYTRGPGPESVPIESPEQWAEIIRRCVVHEREVLLDRIDHLLRRKDPVS